MYSPVLSAIARLISFSRLIEPSAPGSLPPCPASITITQPFSLFDPFANNDEDKTEKERKNKIAIYILMV